MTEEINKSDINKINLMILNKIKNQLESDLSPSQLNSIARLALAFQKEIASDLIDERQKEQEQESFKKVMKMLDQVKAFKRNTPGFEFDL